MKKYLLAAVVLICMTMTCVSLNSCGSDDNDDYSNYVSYTVNPEGSTSTAALYVIDEMRANIDKRFSGEKKDLLYKRNDTKAIQACDEVAENYRTSLLGKITLSVGAPSSDPSSTSKVIKTYNFPY